VEILIVLIPLSVALALFVIVALWWAVHDDQFDELQQEGERILHHD
jgi:cbb3-type cytochrome oxidase maturation protein